MKKLTDKQKEKYPFAADIIEIFNTSSGEDLLKNLEEYVLEEYSYAAEIFNKSILLGTTALESPASWKDWTDEEKIILFDRWDIIERLVALSKAGFFKTQLDKLNNVEIDSEEMSIEDDPNKNNGKGTVS